VHPASKCAELLAGIAAPETHAQAKTIDAMVGAQWKCAHSIRIASDHGPLVAVPGRGEIGTPQPTEPASEHGGSGVTGRGHVATRTYDPDQSDWRCTGRDVWRCGAAPVAGNAW